MVLSVLLDLTRELLGPFLFGVTAFTSVFFAGTYLLKLTNWVMNGMPQTASDAAQVTPVPIPGDAINLKGDAAAGLVVYTAQCEKCGALFQLPLQNSGYVVQQKDNSTETEE